MRYLSRSMVAVAAALIFTPAAVYAQSSQGWFVPSQGGQAGAKHSAAASSHTTHRAPAMPEMGAPIPIAPASDAKAEAAAQAQASAPIPTLPTLMKESPPPPPIIGVIGVPDVLQASAAAQAVEKEIEHRRAALTAQVQKEQDMWRRVQAALANPAAHYSPDELRAREQALQQRIANSQLAFRNSEARIQAAAQTGLGQIERTLIAVIRQVSTSRGMNLVLHRAQVALNMNEFDITDEVTKQLNQVLPSVTVPPDAAFAKVTAASMQAQQQAQQAQQGPLGQ